MPIFSSCPHLASATLTALLPPDTLHCPLCTVNLALNRIALYQALLAARGGVFTSRGTTEKKEHGHVTATRGCNRARIMGANAIGAVREYIEMEERRGGVVDMVASEALRLWEREFEGGRMWEVPGVGVLEEEEEEEGKGKRVASEKGGKRVQIAEGETVFLIEREDKGDGEDDGEEEEESAASALFPRTDVEGGGEGKGFPVDPGHESDEEGGEWEDVEEEDEEEVFFRAGLVFGWSES